MKILAIGDIVSAAGRAITFEVLEKYRHEVDFVISNAENASHGRGLSKPCYAELSRAGIDVFTMGNHTWGCPDIISVMNYEDNILRPANFEGDCPGCGMGVFKARNGVMVGVINLIGRTYMAPAKNPFITAKECVEKLRTKADIIVVDFHAEATSEKLALSYYLDGDVSVVFGTHTHVQTADDTILPKGTGYITDLGMTGPSVSVLGMSKDIIIERFLNGMPQKFEVANGSGQFSGCIFEVDETSKKTIKTERIFIKN